MTRKIKTRTKEALIAASAGRCELPGCPRYLFVHTPTKRSGYFGNYAHIRAFSPGGPRAGRAVDRARVDLNDIENLMLLCPECHVLVDRHAEEYPIAKLQTWKREHEERVTYLLELPGENEAAVIEIWTSLAKPPVVRSYGKVVAALLPLYPSRIHSCLINLADHDLSDMTLVPAAVEQIDKHLGRLFATSGERPTHVAVFGITNIPLLVHLGAGLGDRQDALLFQYHRDSKDWKWKDEPARTEYAISRLREGTNQKRVALLLSLSGTIDLSELPAEIDATYSVYELRLANETPHTGFLRTKLDLDRFREAYRKLLAALQVEHGSLSEIAVVPAVPIPVAVALGMDRLPKVAPALEVYDLDRKTARPPVYRWVLRVE